MADLIDRLSGHSELEDPPRPKLPAHQFTGLIRLYAAGVVSASEIAQDWDLQGAEATQATAIAVAIDAAGSALNKIILTMKLESIVYLLEIGQDSVYHNPDGTINKVRVLADVGL